MTKLISELAKELYVTDAELFEFFEELVSNSKLKPSMDITVKDLPGTIWRYDYIGEQHDAELNDELADIVTKLFKASYKANDLFSVYHRLVMAANNKVLDKLSKDESKTLIEEIRTVFFLSCNYDLVEKNK